MEWYVVFVETGKEENIQKWLSFHFSKDILHSLVPKRRLTIKNNGKTYKILKKLFPGYVFVCTEMDIDKYKKIRSIPKLIRILNTGTYYTKIDEREMDIILKLVGNDDIVDYSKIFIENSRVCVKDGPLCGMEGIIRKVDKHKNRARIELNFMGELRTIDVGVEILYSIA